MSVPKQMAQKLPHRNLFSFSSSEHYTQPPNLALLRSSHVRPRPVPSSTAGVAPCPMVAFWPMPDLLSPVRAPTAWYCSDSGQGEIPASYAGSGDTRGCRHLLEGAVMAVIRAPLRASGETLGPDFWTGRRRRLSVVLPFLKASSCSLATSPTVGLDAGCLHCVRVPSQG